MTGEAGAERRRFERVPMSLEWGPAQALLGARLHWPNHETSAVFDLSYYGLAAAPAALIPVQRDQVLQLELELGQDKPFAIEARVAWVKDKLWGGELLPLESRSRQTISRFMVDRLIGRHLRQVDKRYYARSLDCSVWYHGPHDTNVFLWQDANGRIYRAELEIDGRVLLFDGRHVMTGGASPRTLIDEIGSSVLVGPLVDVPLIASRGEPLVKRALAILSQIDDPGGPIKGLVSALATVVNG